MQIYFISKEISGTIEMLISKKSILIILALLSVLSCGKKYNNEEIEPNNTISSATLIETGKECKGFLDSENDVDNYLLRIDEEQLVRIELSGVKGVNHSIHVWKLVSGNPRPLKTIDDNRKSSPEEMANLFLEPGDYIIMVNHGSRDVKKGNSENSYTLRVTSRSALKEEKEPNDRAENANVINNGESITGFFSPSRNILNENLQYSYREEDWFSVDIVSGEENPVTVDLILTGVNGVDSILALYNSDMNELALSDNAGPGSAETITGFGIKTTGTYYIMVVSKSYQSNHSEPYELTLRTNIHDSRNELEPNNSFENAGRISENQVSGKINYSGDMDYFFYNDMKDSGVRIKLQCDPELDGVLTLYSSDKVKLFEVNNSGAGYEEIAPAVFTGKGIYATVSSSKYNSPDLSYRLTFEHFNMEGDFEKEPNNSIKDSNQFNKSISGFTSFKNDKDYYIIKTGDRAKFKINAVGPKNGAIRISTTDPMGYIIKTRTVTNGESISFQELFDKKGYIIVDTVTPDYDNHYTISAEEIK